MKPTASATYGSMPTHQTVAVTVTSSVGRSTSTRHDVVLRLAASHPARLDTAFSVTLPLGVPLS